MQHCLILVRAERLLCGGVGSGLAVGRANIVLQCQRSFTVPQQWKDQLDPVAEGSSPHALSWGSQGCWSQSSPWLYPVTWTQLCSSFRSCGGDIRSTSACGPGLGYCSAGPGLPPAADEHPHLPPDGESFIPTPALTCLLMVSSSPPPSPASSW